MDLNRLKKIMYIYKNITHLVLRSKGARRRIRKSQFVVDEPILFVDFPFRWCGSSSVPQFRSAITSNT